MILENALAIEKELQQQLNAIQLFIKMYQKTPSVAVVSNTETPERKEEIITAVKNYFRNNNNKFAKVNDIVKTLDAYLIPAVNPAVTIGAFIRGSQQFEYNVSDRRWRMKDGAQYDLPM